MTDLVQIGQIVGSFGLKGQLKVQPSTDFLNRFETGQTVCVSGKWLKIEKMTIHKGRPLIKLEGIRNPETAEALKWAFIEAEGRPALSEDEYLIKDLVGLDIVTDEGKELGKIDEILPYPAHDIIVVGEVMIPLIKEFVKNIDLEGRKVTVHLIPGMMSD